MRISFVTEHKQLETYLDSYDSINLVNTYTNLQTDYDRFSNDLNKVDVFAVIEHADISGSLTAISKLLQSGNGYLLSVGEVLLVLNGSSERTPNRTDKVEAFKEILEEKGYNVRIVIPNVLDFTSIYNAFIKNTVVKESTIKVFTKYKVSKTDNGVVVKPKKSRSKLIPDKKTGNRKELKKLDRDTAAMLGDALLTIDERKDIVEPTVSNIIELPTVAAFTQRIVFVTGVNDVGKTHSMLMFVEELSKSQVSSIAIDPSGKDDMLYISQGNNFNVPIIKGAEIFTAKEQASLGIFLYRKAYSATFLHRLGTQTRGKNVIFCEVELEYLSTYISSWDGEVTIAVVVKFDVTALMELKKNLVPNLPYIIYLNNDKDEVDAAEERLLKQFLGESIKVFNYNSRVDLFNSLGG